VALLSAAQALRPVMTRRPRPRRRNFGVVSIRSNTTSLARTAACPRAASSPPTSMRACATRPRSSMRTCAGTGAGRMDAVIMRSSLVTGSRAATASRLCASRVPTSVSHTSGPVVAATKRWSSGSDGVAQTYSWDRVSAATSTSQPSPSRRPCIWRESLHPATHRSTSAFVSIMTQGKRILGTVASQRWRKWPKKICKAPDSCSVEGQRSGFASSGFPPVALRSNRLPGRT